jgi:hypothetical protein
VLEKENIATATAPIWFFFPQKLHPSNMSFPSVSSTSLRGIAHDGIRLPNHLVVKSVRTDRVYTPQSSISSIDSGTDQNIAGPFEGPFQIIVNKGVNEYVEFSTMPFAFTAPDGGPVTSIVVSNMIPTMWCPYDDHSFFFEGTIATVPTMLLLRIAGRAGGVDAGTVTVSLATGVGFTGNEAAITCEGCTGLYPVFAAPPS